MTIILFVRFRSKWTKTFKRLFLISNTCDKLCWSIKIAFTCKTENVSVTSYVNSKHIMLCIYVLYLQLYKLPFGSDWLTKSWWRLIYTKCKLFYLQIALHVSFKVLRLKYKRNVCRVIPTGYLTLCHTQFFNESALMSTMQICLNDTDVLKDRSKII